MTLSNAEAISHMAYGVPYVPMPRRYLALQYVRTSVSGRAAHIALGCTCDAPAIAGKKDEEEEEREKTVRAREKRASRETRSFTFHSYFSEIKLRIRICMCAAYALGVQAIRRGRLQFSFVA